MYVCMYVCIPFKDKYLLTYVGHRTVHVNILWFGKDSEWQRFG